MTVFGTRPEAIKICPLVIEMKKAELTSRQSEFCTLLPIL